jgi:hypothetical protein
MGRSNYKPSMTNWVYNAQKCFVFSCTSSARVDKKGQWAVGASLGDGKYF